jgi:hypothetical protein
MSDEVVNDVAVNHEVEKSDAVDAPLCEGCDETFSEFLNEMAEQNAKVAACPKCGKVHGFKKTDDTQTESEQPPMKKVS